MRVLILSCDTGGGHNSCAFAIRQAFSEKDICCDTADALAFISDRFSKFMSRGHTMMYRRVPGLFRFGYGFAEKHRSVLEEKTGVYKLLTSGTEELHSFLQKGGYDAVICTHVFSGMLMQQMLLEYPMNIKTAFVATDYTCSPGMPKKGMDYYFISASSLAEEFIMKGVPKEKIVPSGIPVRKEFYIRKYKDEAKRKLGISPENSHLLMMCGSMGCGPIEKLAELIGKKMSADMELSVICGTNEKLREELAEKFSGNPNIHICGFVKNISEFMDSADLYITKPGGLSSSEAAVKGLPMVLIDAVAGCEKFNLEFFVSLGGAVTAETPEELAKICINLLYDETKRKAMSKALESAVSGNAANIICEIMCEEV